MEEAEVGAAFRIDVGHSLRRPDIEAEGRVGSGTKMGRKKRKTTKSTEVESVIVPEQGSSTALLLACFG